MQGDKDMYLKNLQRDRDVSASLYSGSGSGTAPLLNNDNEFDVVDRVYQKLSVEKFESDVTVGTKSLKWRHLSYLSEVIPRSLMDAPHFDSVLYASIHSRQASLNSNVWEGICEVSDEGRNYLKEIKKDDPTGPPIVKEGSAQTYLQKQIFPLLLPALEDTLLSAQEWGCLEVQKCRFNGIDNIAEILWNKNPKYPERVKHWKYIFKIPFVRELLEEHPRPFYPLSWLWSKEKAAIIIQTAVRGYLVRRQPEVQEMRQFWKALQEEKQQEQRRRQEEMEKYRKQFDEEQEQLKAEEAERKRKLNEIREQEEKTLSELISQDEGQEEEIYDEVPVPEPRLESGESLGTNIDLEEEMRYSEDSSERRLSSQNLSEWKTKVLMGGTDVTPVPSNSKSKTQRAPYHSIVSELPSLDTVQEIEASQHSKINKSSKGHGNTNESLMKTHFSGKVSKSKVAPFTDNSQIVQQRSKDHSLLKTANRSSHPSLPFETLIMHPNVGHTSSTLPVSETSALFPPLETEMDQTPLPAPSTNSNGT